MSAATPPITALAALATMLPAAAAALAVVDDDDVIGGVLAGAELVVDVAPELELPWNQSSSWPSASSSSSSTCPVYVSFE
eukprot:CAMPEP_0118865664 /NCGR_PEP_ID=MMETSP1163-20130328/9850_1 /TAXON_ID=124430 /ORGANISM="Phaeomonas parva, Strain CCMP2877" /LENGTH=79 /DNA_ID=CAMNT_0006799909 /DNA_START=46 /DNA_END=286 /DNA_ORIENTATION=+